MYAYIHIYFSFLIYVSRFCFTNGGDGGGGGGGGVVLLQCFFSLSYQAWTCRHELKLKLFTWRVHNKLLHYA